MPDDTTHWTVSISRQTDDAVRSHLARHGEAGSLSRFVEEAVRWRVFEQTLAEARTGFADLSAEEVEALAEEAVAATRHAKATGAA